MWGGLFLCPQVSECASWRDSCAPTACGVPQGYRLILRWLCVIPPRLSFNPTVAVWYTPRLSFNPTVAVCYIPKVIVKSYGGCVVYPKVIV